MSITVEHVVSNDTLLSPGLMNWQWSCSASRTETLRRKVKPSKFENNHLAETTSPHTKLIFQHSIYIHYRTHCLRPPVLWCVHKLLFLRLIYLFRSLKQVDMLQLLLTIKGHLKHLNRCYGHSSDANWRDSWIGAGGSDMKWQAEVGSWCTSI